LDPEEVEAIMSRIKTGAVRIVESHGGIVNQFVGDEVLALFGIPTTHEDDPRRAVTAALELHELARDLSAEVEPRIGAPLRMHTGINTGLVVTHLRDDREGRYGITGDSVNSAARLASRAETDEILLSPDTRRLVAPFFDLEELAPVAVKGKAMPMVPYRVVGASGIATRFEAAQERGLTPYTGREAELASLHGALEKAIAGRGQLVTVSGEAGLGKSRLLHEFRHGLDRDKVTVLQGRCQSYGANTPYLPFTDALARGVGLRDDMTPTELARTMEANLLTIDSALETHLPILLHLLSIPSADRLLPEALRGEALRKASQEALAAVMLAQAGRRPVVLVLEDWHWTDEASDSALRYLLGLAPTHRLLVVVNYRPEYESGWGPLEHHVHLAIAPLGGNHSEIVARAVLEAQHLPEGLGELIHERTGGNPFFIEEMCRDLLESGTLLVKDGQGALTRPAEKLELPGTVQGVIRSRLDRLAEDQREVLRLASVIGREFDHRLLARARGHGAGDEGGDHHGDNGLTALLEQMEAQGLIRQVRMPPDAAYQFKHVLTQVVVYETLLLERRKSLHGLVGRALEELFADRLEEHYEALAFHFQSSEIWRSAVRYYKAAAVRAASLSAHREAAALLRKALAALEKLPQDDSQGREAIDIRILLRHSLFPLQLFEEIGTVLEEARPVAEKLKDRSRLGAILTLLTTHHLGIGSHQTAIRLGSEALWIANEHDDGAARRSILFQLIQANVSMGDYKQAISLDRRLLAEGEADESTGLAQLTFVSLARMWLVWCLAEIGEFAEAFAQSKQTLSAAQTGGQPLPLLLAHLAQGLALLRQGSYADAAAALEQARPLSLAPAMEAWWAAVASPLGRAYAGIGRLEEAIGLLEEAVSRTTSTRGTGSAMRILHLGEAYLLAGRPNDAQSMAGKAMELAASHHERGNEAYAHLLLGQICGGASQEDREQALTHFGAAAGLAEKLSMQPLQARSFHALAILQKQAGKGAEARQAFDSARGIAEEIGMAELPAGI
ncbi:MAG: AAA family ATPase, partial [bacterium]